MTVVIGYCNHSFNMSALVKRGSIMRFLVSFAKMMTFNQLPHNSRMTREKKSTQFLKGTTRDLFLRILETKTRELEKR